MNDALRIEVNVAGIVILLFTLRMFYQQIKARDNENKLFAGLVYMTIALLALDSIFWLIDTRDFVGGRQLNYTINYLYYFLQITECYVWFMYCGAHLGYKCTLKNAFISSIIYLPGVALLIVNLFDNCVFSVSENNVYQRGWGLLGTTEAICCMLYPCLSLVLIICEMFKKRTSIKRSDCYYLIIVSMIPLVGAIVQLSVYGLNIIWIGMSLSLLLILWEVQMKRYRSMQKMLTEQKVQMLLGQIQPHFLYNCLITIEELCDVDIVIAKKGVNNFTNYLRSNLDSLQIDSIINFKQELKHIQSFLMLEEMQFGDYLKVEYNIEIDDFMLPSLSVQPIVENAVFYGIGKKEDGGTVRISTRERENAIEIIVEDDGAGFDSDNVKKDDRSHVGLSNVRQRIETMAGGKMSVKSVIGSGTMVIVSIPRGGSME